MIDTSQISGVISDLKEVESDLGNGVNEVLDSRLKEVGDNLDRMVDGAREKIDRIIEDLEKMKEQIESEEKK